MALSDAPAQTAVEAWVQRYTHPADSNDEARKVVTDHAGNVVVAGYTDDGITGPDFLVIKYSGAGVALWTNRYNGPGDSSDYASAVVVDGSGNGFVTGRSYTSSSEDCATVAYSGAGVALWTNRYSGGGATAIAVDGSGNVFVTGSSEYDYVTIKYSGAGVPLWINRYNGLGSNSDGATAIAVDGCGDVFVTGGSYDTNGSSDYATVAYSGAGVPLWTNRYNGPGNDSDAAAAIAVDGSGNVFVTGYSYDNGSSDYATVAYSGVGVPLWTNRYDGPGNGDDRASAIAVDGVGNVFVTGYSFSSPDYVTIKYSGVGVPLWTNRHNGSGYANALAVDGRGNVFVTGVSETSSSSDYATVAYSGVGVPLWTNRYNGPGDGSDQASAIAVDGSGNVSVTGSSEGDYATVAYSGTGVPLWTNRYNGPADGGGQATALAVDDSGNVFVTGGSSGDYATVACSGAGVPLWTNRYNGTGNNYDRANAVAVDGSGNVFVTGRSYSGSSFNSADYATVAYSGAGVPLWTNRYDGPGNGDDQATAIAVDGSGNVFVTGYSTASDHRYNYTTIKYSGAGVPLWTNRYSGPANRGDQAYSLGVDGSGNVFVTGSSRGSDGTPHYLTIKYSGAGIPLWTNRYNGSGYASALAVDGSGNVFVTGYTWSSSGGTPHYLTIKYSGAGVPLWANRYNGPGDSGDGAYAIAVDGSGNVFVTGSSEGDYATIKYSSAGVPLWTNRYNGTGNKYDRANAVAVDARGNVFVTGSSYNSDGSSDYATVAYSGAGLLLWTKRYHGPKNYIDQANAIAVDAGGNVFVTGYSYSNSSPYYATIKYVSPIPLNYQIVGNQFVLSWTNAGFSLQSAPAVQGTFTTIPGATSPYSTDLPGAQQYFRLKGN